MVVQHLLCPTATQPLAFCQRSNLDGIRLRHQAVNIIPRALPKSEPGASSSSARASSAPLPARVLPQPSHSNVPQKAMPEQDASDSASTSGSDVTAGLTSGWVALPARFKLIVACAGSFVICNMDKVNMSVAIIPMAQDFGWSSSVSGIVQSAFFYGYLLTQIPSGILSSKYGGRSVLPAGVGLWSFATASVPLLASTIPGLCLSRAMVGLGEAVAPSAAIDVVARVVPAAERSRAVAFIFSGLHVGSILGLLIAPALISEFGWEAVFVSFGVLGLVWVAWFEGLLSNLDRTDPDVTAALSGIAASSSGSATTASGGSGAREAVQEASSSGDNHHGGVIDSNMHIPWRAFLRCRPVQALMWTHFTNNWFHYTMLAWLPTYFVDTLSVDLMHASQTALLPPLAGIAASAIAGPAADILIANGMPTATVRKLAQCTAFLVPSALLLATCSPDVVTNSTLTIACITLALGISSFSLAGLYCTHQDLSPKYAPALLGLTNTAGAMPGIIGVVTVGFLYDQFQCWELCLFAPSAILMMTGAFVYTVFGRNDAVDFDAEDDTPFEWEERLRWMQGGKKP